MDTFLKITIICLLVVGVVTPSLGQESALSPQEAEDAAEVERLSAQGVQAYKAKDYAEAVSLFQQALAIQPVPNLLYNIARACELMGDDRKAKFYFSKFIRAKDVTEDARNKARKRLADLESRLLEAAPEPAPKGSAETSGGRPMIVGGSDESPQLEVIPLVGWISLSTGAAALIASSVLASQMNGEYDSFKKTDNLQAKHTYRSNAESLGLAADVGFSVGGALLGTGVGLLLWDAFSDDGSAASSVRVSPSFQDGGWRVSGGFSF